MLLKWLFTLLAILWLYQAIKPFFASNQVNRPTPPDNLKARRRDEDDDGEYIDYEEIK